MFLFLVLCLFLLIMYFPCDMTEMRKSIVSILQWDLWMILLWYEIASYSFSISSVGCCWYFLNSHFSLPLLYFFHLTHLSFSRCFVLMSYLIKFMFHSGTLLKRFFQFKGYNTEYDDHIIVISYKLRKMSKDVHILWKCLNFNWDLNEKRNWKENKT